MAKKNSASVPVRRDSGASVGRRQAIEAIRAPIAYFSLVLLVIEAILAVTAARATDQQIQIILSYGMIASLIILLVGFLAALFTRPDVLFQTASRNDPIAEFRKLGDELTGNDLAIIARMLGSKPALFDTFYVQTNLESISQINNRLRKLIGLNLVKLCGDSEVELTALGTNYAQCVAKFSSALTCNNTPQDIIATVIDPSIIIIVSHSILEYVPSLAENEFNNVSQFSEHKPPLLEKIGSLQELRQLLLRNTFDVVVFCAYVNSGGAMRISENETLGPDALVELLKITKARLAILSACKSLALASRLGPYINVIASEAILTTKDYDAWGHTFWQMLSRGVALTEASKAAAATSEARMVLLLKNNLVFEKKSP